MTSLQTTNKGKVTWMNDKQWLHYLETCSLQQRETRQKLDDF